MSHKLQTRTYNLYADSRDHVGDGLNPDEYTIRLGRVLPNVKHVRMVGMRMPYSPYYVVTRTSQFMDSGVSGVVASQDDVHQAAVVIETANNTEMGTLGSRDPTDLTRPVRLYKSDGTVDLNVIEVHTRELTRTDGSVRTYDTYLCTGDLTTTSTASWQLEDLTASVDLPLTGASSETATAASTDPGDSALVFERIEMPVHMMLNIGARGRLRSSRMETPKWRSNLLYREGQRVSQGTTEYICITTHYSLVFANDLALGLWKSIFATTWMSGTVYDRTDVVTQGSSEYEAQAPHTATNFSADRTLGYWKSVPRAKQIPAPAADAFHVIAPVTTTETTYQMNRDIDDVYVFTAPTNVQDVTITFHDRLNRPFAFPQEVRTEMLDLEGTETYRREYKPHSVTLEFTYEEPKVTERNDGAPGFLLNSESPLMLPMPRRY